MFKGTKTRFELNFFEYFVISRDVNIYAFLNSLSKFERQILRYKRVTEVRILWFVNKARVQSRVNIVYILRICSIGTGFNLMMFFVVDKVIYEQIELILSCFHKFFC